MRIQHNIAALNSYRNLTNNNSAVAKNLEKLSSGYRINRAGDDAAGLAISEKMRAQITGLNTAQKNANDGISLVQTAEGALTEVHSMLNRMVELANQSANGTYADAPDRDNLQAEIDSLKEEIDRISKATNFNGINLLDGSRDGNIAKVDTVMDTLDKTQLAGRLLDPATDGTAGIVGTNTVFESTDTGSGKPAYSVNLNGLHYTKGDDAYDDPSLKLTINGVDTTIDLTDAFADKKPGDVLSGKDIAKVVYDYFQGDPAGDGVGVYKDTADNDTLYNVTLEGDSVVFTAQEAPTSSANKHFDVTITDASTRTATAGAATGKIWTTDKVTGTTATAAGKVQIEAMIEGKTYTFSVDIAQNGTAPSASTIGKATTKMTVDGVEKDVKLSDYFAVGGSATKGYTFTDNTVGKEGSGNSIKTVTSTAEGLQFGTNSATATLTPTEGKDAYTIGMSGSINVSTTNVIMSNPGGTDRLANTVLDLTGMMKDGTQVKLGDTTYTFAVGKDSAYKDAENVVDLTKYTGEETDFDAIAASKLTEAAKGNKIFSVGHRNDAGKIGLQQLEEVKDTTEMDDMDQLLQYIDIKVVNTAKTAEAEAAAKKAAEGKEALTLQIGDTSDDFNKMKVSIGDMSTKALGIGDINISTQAGASEAVNKIKEAINKVSSQRGDLGAIQNRLEHTINNLSVTAENITAAESRIRDVDMAEEMMAYTKNNILVQAAQAMLAQANQVPQGVLQLLQ